MKALRCLPLLLLALRCMAAAPEWRYTVTLRADRRELLVEAAFDPGPTDEFSVDDGAEPFLREVEAFQDGAWRPVPLQRDTWYLAAARHREIRLRYRFLLEQAARGLHDRDLVEARSGLILAAPSVFLLRPWNAARSARAALRFRAATGQSVLCGIFQEPSGAQVLAAADLENAPQVAFGRFRTLRVEAAGGVVDAAVPAVFPTGLDGPVELWIRQAMESIQAVAGRFPLPRAALYLLPSSRGSGVVFGSTGGRGGAVVTILAAPDLGAADLRADWVLTHEFVHLCVPTMPERHAWFTEGLATYLEPLARVRRGLLKPESCWAAFQQSMPEGLPRAGDRGLDRTPTWGRTYWGGALFCLVADLEIRKATQFRQGLDDALKAMVAAGVTKAVAMDLEAILRTADRGLEKPVLLRLYRRWATAPVAVDLAALWSELGVQPAGSSVGLDASAPGAAVWKAR